jgi:hypothetical protein
MHEWDIDDYPFRLAFFATFQLFETVNSVHNALTRRFFSASSSTPVNVEECLRYACETFLNSASVCAYHSHFPRIFTLYEFWLSLATPHPTQLRAIEGFFERTLQPPAPGFAAPLPYEVRVKVEGVHHLVTNLVSPSQRRSPQSHSSQKSDDLRSR